MLSRSPERLLTACGRSGVRATRRDVPDTVDQVLTRRWPVIPNPVVQLPWRAVFTVDHRSGLTVESLFSSTSSEVDYSSSAMHETANSTYRPALCLLVLVEAMWNTDLEFCNRMSAIGRPGRFRRRRRRAPAASALSCVSEGAQPATHAWAVRPASRQSRRRITPINLPCIRTSG